MRIVIDKPKFFEALFHAVFTIGGVLVFFHLFKGIGLRTMLGGLAGGIGFLVVWYGTDLLRAYWRLETIGMVPRKKASSSPSETKSVIISSYE